VNEERRRAPREGVPDLSAEVYRSITYERRRRLVRRAALGSVVGLVVAVAGVQWFRPLPSPTFQSALLRTVRLAGTPLSLPWPTHGVAAMSLEGIGVIGQVGSTQPVPITGLTKVMTAYVVLKDHPLDPEADGPAIAVTAATIAEYQAELASQQSVVPVAAGETLTEAEALEALLVASGNDIATLLAEWDAGSTSAFVAKMNAAAHGLGLGATTFSDPSGFDSRSVSTPTDMIKLGEAAMALPVFRQIAALPQVTLPLAGLVYSLDYDLGHDGFVGIKTGSDSAAGGCFLFEAQRTVGGQEVTLVGAVLGQRTASPTAAALDSAASLVRTAFTALGPMTVLAPGRPVGSIVAPWGPSVPVTMASSPSVLGWPGMTLPVEVHVGRLPTSVARGARVGQLDLGPPGQQVAVVLRASRAVGGPSVIWRLTRL
jgi:D-alanyl-D-alanine carboxypeptidase (penicillin-binding protein 5/6)